jgi:EmrB/QacA subfamily drug resistance transporter
VKFIPKIFEVQQESKPLSRKRLNLITLGIMLSLFLSSMEGTVVSTAMPTIVGQLGGLAIYSWVFAIYMLTSTTIVPIYGKLSDLFGRKRLYTISMLIFLVGSVLCSQAQSMEQLIFFRAVQGLGAGGVLPLAFTVIGELFSLEQRARMQGLFSGVWGVSSIIGPLIGGFLVDQVSWHWVFLINIFPGLLAVGLVWFAWKDGHVVKTNRAPIDFWGALLLTLGAIVLLLGLNQLSTPWAAGLLAGAAVLFAALIWVERRAADPILPLGLFRDRLYLIANLHGVLAGWAMFGGLNFVPLFMQGALSTSATQAGITLTPSSLSWTLASIFGTRLLLKVGYRVLILVGSVSLAIGCFFMTTIGTATSQLQMMIYTGLMGLGMGLSIPPFLIAVQSSVRKQELGIATSTLQFSRSIGGTIGVGVLGVFLASRLNTNLIAAGVDPTQVDLNGLLDPIARANATAALGGELRAALAVTVASLFILSFVAALLALAVVFFTPRGTVAQLGQDRAAAPPAEM